MMAGIVRRVAVAAMVLGGVGVMVGQVPVAGQAQDGSTPAYAMQVTSRLVLLDVVVTDAEGRFVPGLDVTKFRVEEDGVPQGIRNFDAPEGHVMPAALRGKLVVNSSADLVKIGNAPVNVLVVDEINTPYMEIAYTQQMMVRFLMRQPKVLEQPTLLVAVGSKHLMVLHDFTQNREDLVASVKTHVTEADFTAMLANLNGGSMVAEDGMLKTLSALMQVATSVQGYPGRKNVIWMGPGYSRTLEVSRGLRGQPHSSAGAVVRLVTNRMLVAHITLYTIDPAGPYRPHSVGGPGGPGMDQAATGGEEGDVYTAPGRNATFHTFARSTGGTVITGRNDLDAQITKSEQQGSRYYTLAYTPAFNAGAKPEAFRKIQVMVDVPGVSVTTRNGYFGGREEVAQVMDNTAKTQPPALVSDLLNAGRSQLVYTGLHSDAQRTKDGYAVNVQAKDLQWAVQGDGTRESEVTVMGACFDSKGKLLAQHAAELREQIAPTDDIGGAAKVGFAFPFVVPPNTARVRIVVRDAATGTMGTVNAQL
ncbi:MAG: VWA domain-containing protein [Acidobacteriota bacterium]